MSKIELPSVGVVGMGFVGGSIFRGFKLYADVHGYDIDEKRSTASLAEVAGCEYIFIALPTPMATVEGGRCDIGLIDKAIADVMDCHTYSDGLIIIKSTIPPGTTDAMIEKHNNPLICHSPEFLTERAALADFLTPARQIIGASNRFIAAELVQLYKMRFPGVPILSMSPRSAELVKYGANCFFAVKVMYFNELYQLAESMNADWDDVLEGVMSDGRIGHSHNQVPGHDGDMGFGGKCFPKDINAILTLARDRCLDLSVMEGAWDENLRIRQNRDWADIKGAVVE